jgi:hypothetical protein
MYGTKLYSAMQGTDDLWLHLQVDFADILDLDRLGFNVKVLLL